MREGFLWCPHCAKPHAIGTKICPTTARSLDRALHRQPPSDHPLIGTIVAGKYRVISHIGRGGMGDVFEAENIVLKRSVALKVVRREGGASSAEARLRREAELVASIDHPNICDVYDVGELPDGSPFLVLQRLAGETLSKHLARSGPLRVPEAVDLFTQLLSGLQAAHGVHIIHRDLKPSNVFLVDRVGLSPLVKIVDFGLAKQLSGAALRATLTSKGSTVGTPLYMAPEQLRGEQLDARADLFTVGGVLYEALAGEHPFDAPSPTEITVKILRDEPAAMTTRTRRPVPPAVEAVVRRALEKDPERRFRSALEMQNSLVAAARA